MLEYDWENSIGHWVCSTSHAMRKVLTAALACEGITFRQWEVLAYLSCDGTVSQTELAESIGIEPHTLAGVINRMERDGFLERKSCQLDRRKNLISATPKAEEIWARTTEICHEVREQAIQGLSAEELQLFRKLCETIRDNLTESLKESVPSLKSRSRTDAVEHPETPVVRSIP